MVEIIFIYNTIPLSIKSNNNEKLYNIFKKFALKTGNNINDLLFLYSGRLIDPQKTFNEVANSIDKMEGKMTILVYSNKESYKISSGKNNNNIIPSNNITLEDLLSNISQMKNEFNDIINKNTNEINALKYEIIYLKDELKKVMDTKKIKISVSKEIEFNKNKNSEIKEYIDTLFKTNSERNDELLKQIKVNHADNAIKLQNCTIGVKPNSIVKVEHNGKIFSDIIFTRGMIMAWYGTKDLIPNGWVICDGKNGAPDLTNKFILGADKLTNCGKKGGQSFIKLSKNNLPPIGTAGFSADSHRGSYHHKSTGFIKYKGHYSVGVKNGAIDDWGSNWLIDLNEGMNSTPINIMNPYLTLFYIMKL